MTDQFQRPGFTMVYSYWIECQKYQLLYKWDIASEQNIIGCLIMKKQWTWYNRPPETSKWPKIKALFHFVYISIDKSEADIHLPGLPERNF